MGQGSPWAGAKGSRAKGPSAKGPRARGLGAIGPRARQRLFFSMAVSLPLHVRPLPLTMIASAAADGEPATGPQALLPTLTLGPPQLPPMARHSLQRQCYPCAKDRVRRPWARAQWRRPSSWPAACDLHAPRATCVNLAASTTRFLDPLVVRVTAPAPLPKITPLSMSLPLRSGSPWRQHMQKLGARRDLGRSCARLARQFGSCAAQAVLHSAHPSCP